MWVCGVCTRTTGWLVGFRVVVCVNRFADNGHRVERQDDGKGRREGSARFVGVSDWEGGSGA